MDAQPPQPGLVVLFGSGEISASGRRVYDWLLSRRPPRRRVAVLETPAGFQPNSAQVAGEVADFIRERARNHRPRLQVVPARKRGTAYSPDDPVLVAPLLQADVIFIGPGSPTYAARELAGSLAWRYVLARHRLGGDIVLASAATIAAGALTLPVYEIYKAGEDLHWRPGLDLLAAYGLSLVFVPHWNNAEGGAGLDTSRCYMGRERFERLKEMLDPSLVVMGIDEHTALVIDFATGTCLVMGLGGVTVCRGDRETRFAAGASFAVDLLGAFHPEPGDDLPPEVWRAARAALAEATEEEKPPEPSPETERLLREREEARARRDWAAADALRERIGDLGWQVTDTREGPRLERRPEEEAER